MKFSASCALHNATNSFLPRKGFSGEEKFVLMRSENRVRETINSRQKFAVFFLRSVHKSSFYFTKQETFMRRRATWWAGEGERRKKTVPDCGNKQQNAARFVRTTIFLLNEFSFNPSARVGVDSRFQPVRQGIGNS